MMLLDQRRDVNTVFQLVVKNMTCHITTLAQSSQTLAVDGAIQFTHVMTMTSIGFTDSDLAED